MLIFIYSLWSGSKIAEEFLYAADEDAASSQFLLLQFSKLPKKIMIRTYEELSKIHSAKGLSKYVEAYGALAFCNEQGCSATNEERGQALSRALQTSQQEGKKEEKRSSPAEINAKR